MTDRDDGGPAFPFDYKTTDPNYPDQVETHPGMSLRDYYAGKAMEGLVALSSVEMLIDGSIQGIVAGAAYELADAMIEARKR